MTQSPYGGAIQPDEIIVEQRTSILAILSFVFGLLSVILCIVPGVGLIAILCGIFALIGISSSRGRVVGRGLAITGLVLGIFFTAIWIGALVAGSRGWNEMQTKVIPSLTQVMVQTEGSDFAAARKHLTSTSANGATDEDFRKFREAYQAELGSYQSAPTAFTDYVGSLFKSGKAMQGFQGGQNVIPIPANFSKGPAILIFETEVRGGNAPGEPDIKTRNLVIATPAGTKITLWDPSKAPPPVVPSTPTVPPETPKKDEAPKPEEKK